MQIGREGCCVCVFESKIYVFGGVNSDEDAIPDIELYDPATNTWSLLRAKLPDDPGRGLGGCCAVDGFIYIIGGFMHAAHLLHGDTGPCVFLCVWHTRPFLTLLGASYCQGMLWL